MIRQSHSRTIDDDIQITEELTPAILNDIKELEDSFWLAESRYEMFIDCLDLDTKDAVRRNQISTKTRNDLMQKYAGIIIDW